MKDVVRGLTEKRTPAGIPVFFVHYTADPDRAVPEWKETERKKYTSEGSWQREQEIVFSAGGGERLFAEILSRWGHKIIIDPASGFQPPPNWRSIGGFDVGKANPTAALVGAVDFEGCIYILREYYQPGLAPKQHVPALAQLEGFLNAEIFADPSIFFRTQAQTDGTFKAIEEMYAEVGVSNLSKAPETNELLGMERILSHWMNLDEQEPTLKIVCPKRLQDIGKPIYGVHNEGCPNLLWELRRARREQLTAVQLANRNPSEKIVDIDNHLRDCLKYLTLTLPPPARKPYGERLADRVAKLWKENDPTTAMLQIMKIRQEESEEEVCQSFYYGGNIRHRLAEEAAKGYRG
jgi:hypothetical protein